MIVSLHTIDEIGKVAFKVMCITAVTISIHFLTIYLLTLQVDIISITLVT